VELTASRAATNAGLIGEDFPIWPLLQTGRPIRLNVDALVKGLRAHLVCQQRREGQATAHRVHLGLGRPRAWNAPPPTASPLGAAPRNCANSDKPTQDSEASETLP